MSVVPSGPTLPSCTPSALRTSSQTCMAPGGARHQPGQAEAGMCSHAAPAGGAAAGAPPARHLRRPQLPPHLVNVPGAEDFAHAPLVQLGLAPLAVRLLALAGRHGGRAGTGGWWRAAGRRRQRRSGKRRACARRRAACILNEVLHRLAGLRAPHARAHGAPRRPPSAARGSSRLCPQFDVRRSGVDESSCKRGAAATLVSCGGGAHVQRHVGRIAPSCSSNAIS